MSSHKKYVQVYRFVNLMMRAGMREGGLPLPPAFQYLILMTWKACYLDLVMVSSLASKWQGFKFGMLVFQLYEMKLMTSKFKALAFWGQWRYHDEIQITSSSYHKNQILKRLIHYVQLKKYDTAPYFFLLNQNLTCDCLLISVFLPEFDWICLIRT